MYGVTCGPSLCFKERMVRVNYNSIQFCWFEDVIDRKYLQGESKNKTIQMFPEITHVLT